MCPGFKQGLPQNCPRQSFLCTAEAIACGQVPEIRNFMDTFKSITFFFFASRKRKGILSEKLLESAGNDVLADSGVAVVTEVDQCEDVIALRANKNRYHLPTLSDTRWLSRVDSIITLLSNYESVHETLDEVRVQSTARVLMCPLRIFTA